VSQEPQTSTSSSATGGNGGPRALPGRQALPRDFILRHQQERIFNAVIELVAAHGYEPVTVADIVKQAGIARSTFYERFSDKEACFLAAYDWLLERVMGELAAAYQGAEGPWEGKVAAGIALLLRWVVERPLEARIFFVEALTAGPAAVERYDQTTQAFAMALRLGRRETTNGGQLPPTMEESLVGGAIWILYQRITKGETNRVEELLPQLVELVLTPYLGAAEAKRLAMEAPPAAEPSTGEPQISR